MDLCTGCQQIIKIVPMYRFCQQIIEIVPMYRVSTNNWNCTYVQGVKK